MTEQSKTQVSDNGNPSDFQSENAGSIPAACSNALEAFEKFLKQKSLSNEKDRDAWGEEIFKHPKIEAMWYAWKNCHEQALTQQEWQSISDMPEEHKDLCVEVAFDEPFMGSVIKETHLGFYDSADDKWFFDTPMCVHLEKEILRVTHYKLRSEPPTQGESE